MYAAFSLRGIKLKRGCFREPPTWETLRSSPIPKLGHLNVDMQITILIKVSLFDPYTPSILLEDFYQVRACTWLNLVIKLKLWSSFVYFNARLHSSTTSFHPGASTSTFLGSNKSSAIASSSLVNERKHLKKMESRSYFWWLDNHIGPKSSKWLAENLDEMDRNVKLMLELIEDDGDSFAKKVEMYYQKRPKLVSYVEEFYRMYRSLAERYDHLTGELRKNVLPGLQNQALASSDMGSEATPAWISPDSNTIRRQSGHRAAGFDFFLGSGKGNPNRHSKGDETSSLSDWETESEVSSIHSYLGIPRNVTEEGLHGKMVESEFRLHDEKEKLQIQEGSGHDSLSMTRSKNLDDLNSKLLDYEEELKIAKEKICLSEEEIVDLKAKLQNLSSLEDNSQHSLPLAENSLNRETMMQIEQLRADVAEQTNQLQTLREEFEALKLRHDRLSSEKDELTTNILKLTGEVDIKNDQIKQLEKQVEGEQEIVGELKIQVLELKILINEGAEEKREAIRQLCFSLEHYRNGYQQLRQAFTGHQQLLIFAS